MRQRFRSLTQMVAALALFSVAHAANCQSALPPARDLAADALEIARTHTPLIVMVSLSGCPHCEMVRNSHLLPLIRDQTSPARAMVRQVEINGAMPLRDFDGSTITHAEFAARHKIKIAPVVMFFGPNGETLAKPLVGSMIADFYGAYLDAALTEAKARLAP